MFAQFVFISTCCFLNCRPTPLSLQTRHHVRHIIRSYAIWEHSVWVTRYTTLGKQGPRNFFLSYASMNLAF